jgi:hypothetical protein
VYSGSSRCDDDDDDDDNNNNNKYQGTTENSYIGHSTHTAGSANVEAPKEFNIADSAICIINSRRGIAVALHNLETWFVSGV